MNKPSKAKSKGGSFIFRLFVADDEPHSKTAKENLRKLCESYINKPYEIEMIDVLQSFNIALENNIFLTPTLMKISPGPVLTVVGDLSDTEELIKVLRLGGD